jgi:hypothetical protein
MNNLHKRVLQIEQKQSGDHEINIIRLVIDPDKQIPRGYSCEGVDILKIEGETEERFTQRLFDSGGRIFLPIYRK